MTDTVSIPTASVDDVPAAGGVSPDRPLPTKREFLSKLDPPLAKSVEQARDEGKRGGGRLSKAAHERIALELANPAGQRFSDA